MEKENPFYHNYVFKKCDLTRNRLTLPDKLSVIFRPMYTQISEGYAIHYKTKADGRIFIFGFEEYAKPKHHKQ